MKTKLTLNLDQDVIDRAKSLARQRKKSLSNIVQDYLQFITLDKPQPEDVEISPVVRKLAGTLKVDPNLDYKKAYRDHLEKKYLK